MAAFAVLWISPDGLLVRLVSVDSWTLLFWRGALWALALGVYLAAVGGRPVGPRFRALGVIGMVVALLYAVITILAVTAFTRTTIANTLVIIAATPMIAAVLSRLFLGEQVPRRTWVAVCAVFGALVVVFSGQLGGGALLGDLCALAAACCLAGQITLLRHARDADMLPTVVVSGVLVALVMAPLASPFAISPRDAGLLLLMGVVVLPLPTCLLLLAPKHIPAADVGLVRLLEAVLGPLWVWLVLTEMPSRETILGGAVILVTLVAHSLAARRRKYPEPSA